jgi:hypothetical protein
MLNWFVEFIGFVEFFEFVELVVFIGFIVDPMVLEPSNPFSKKSNIESDAVRQNSKLEYRNSRQIRMIE